MTRRGAQWIGWTLAVLIGVPLCAILAVLIGANTGPGRRAIAAWVPGLSGGMARIEGLGGRFPDAIRIQRLQVTDTDGVYVTLTNVALDWSPFDLVHRRVEIERLAADTITLDRLPKSSGGSRGGLPDIPIRLRRLSVNRLEIGPNVMGSPAVLTLEGSGDLMNPTSGQARLAIARHDRPADRYRLNAVVDPARIQADLTVEEAAGGLIALIAGLPDLGPMTLSARLDGPETALATRVDLAAGLAHAALAGTLDAMGRTADMTVTASAPAMAPGPGIAWSSVSLDARVNGPIAAPAGTGTLAILGLSAAGVSAAALKADMAGTAGGDMTIRAAIDGLRVPGPDAMLFAAEGPRLDVTLKPDGSARFTLKHALITAEGTAETAANPHLHANVSLPLLARFSTVAGAALDGHANLAIDATKAGETMTLAMKGTTTISGGVAPVPALIGDAGTIDLLASMTGGTVTLTRFDLGGANVAASVTGRSDGQSAAIDWRVHLGSLAALHADVSGTLDAKGHVEGPLTSLALTSDLTANLSARGYHPGQITARVTAQGLPNAPTAKVSAMGSLLDAPLTLDLAVEPRDGVPFVTLSRLAWKSLSGSGTIAIPSGEVLPTGQMDIAMTHLADLTPLLGQPVTGALTARFEGKDQQANLHATLKQTAIPGTVSLAGADLTARITDAGKVPSLDGVLILDGIDAAGTKGGLRLTAKGTAEALALRLTSGLTDLAGAPAQIEAAATANTTGKTLTLETARAAWKTETLRLLGPAHLRFTDRVSVDHLRLGLRTAVLDLSGSAGQRLDLRASLTNLPADLAAVVLPDLAIDGTLSGEARLTGLAVSPDGTVTIKANGLHSRGGDLAGLPAANITLTTALKAGIARLDGRMTAGRLAVTLSGTAPMAGSGPLALRLGGDVDAAIANPILAASGRYVRGSLGLNIGIAGTVAAPRASGSVRLVRGEFQDADLGTRISDIEATLSGDGDTLRLTQFTGKAGQGTIGGDGTIGLTGARPLAITLRADNARLLASDLVTAVTGARLRITGALGGPITVAGSLSVQQVDIQVPERLPSSIVVLKTRDAGKPVAKPPPPPKPSPDIALDVTVDAPQGIYIRGRGVDAELAGRVVLKGTARTPLPQGGLHLRRGTVSLAGTSLALTEGDIAFANADVTNPSLKLIATSVSTALTATLTISGSVKDPKITLSSVPDLPQDEILSQLLFNSARSRLSPFQLVQIAAALASLSGAGPGIGDPLAGVRSALGFDELSVGSGAKGNPTLQAGRYLAPGVRLGARQNATGSGTEATIQIDITKGLKLETTAGTGSSSATGGGSGGGGASVGLKYQFEY